MRRLTLRLAVAIITFTVGVVIAFWLTNRHSSLLKTYNESIVIEEASRDASSLRPDTDEEYAVYSAVLNSHGYAGTLVVIRDRTFTGDVGDLKYLKERMPEMCEWLFGDYQAKNKEMNVLHNNFNIEGECAFITDREMERLFRKGNDGWADFSKKYPGAQGIITLSRVGFDLDRKQALVNVGIGCDWLCGEGNMILLHKENDRWVIQKRFVTWVS